MPKMDKRVPWTVLLLSPVGLSLFSVIVVAITWDGLAVWRGEKTIDFPRILLTDGGKGCERGFRH